MTSIKTEPDNEAQIDESLLEAARVYNSSYQVFPPSKKQFRDNVRQLRHLSRNLTPQPLDILCSAQQAELYRSVLGGK